MKRLFLLLISSILIAALLMAGSIYGIVWDKEETFHDSYQSVMQDKFELLLETDEPKIVIVSGSSSAYGLRQDYFEAATGYKVVNLGLHAGFGPIFYTELAKANINEGDIILLGYEEGWQTIFDHMDQSLCMSAIDNHVEIYQYLSTDILREFAGYVFDYADLKANYEGQDTSEYYNRYVFDQETLQMILYRPDGMDYDPAIHGHYNFDDFSPTISDVTIDYLRDFKEYVESRGASVYFTMPPVAESSITFDYQYLVDLMELEEEVIGIECISNPVDYIFPDSLMSNSMYHCNTEGEVVRTELLVEDLRREGII